MFDHPRRRGFRIGAARVIAAAAVVALLGIAGARAGDIFQITGVDVDVTAETAAMAREQALRDGETRAFQRLLERLTLRVDHGHLPHLGVREIEGYVKDFSIAEEKTSAVRYLARLNVRFKAERVRRLLTESGLPFAETPSKPVLVLPVYWPVCPA